jgi:GTP-binding protein
MLFKQSKERISTSMLNKLVQAALERHEPPLYQLKRPRIYYATQVASQPPTIVLVCNSTQGFSNQYRRYLLNFLRDHLPFGEIPIKLYLQPRKRDDDRDDIQTHQRPSRNAKPGEQWEGAFDDQERGSNSYGESGFEGVDLEDDDEFEDDDVELEEDELADDEIDEDELGDEDELELEDAPQGDQAISPPKTQTPDSTKKDAKE